MDKTEAGSQISTKADALLSASEVEDLIAGKAISGAYPWYTGHRGTIEDHLRQTCADVQRRTGTESRIKWTHYGSGYASFVDAWFYKPTPAFRVGRPVKHSEAYTGLVVLVSRLSPHYALMEGEKAWSDSGGNSYLPDRSMVDRFHTEAVAQLATEAARALDARGMTRVRPEQAAIPLAEDLIVPTLLAEKPFAQFDAIFHSED